MSIKEVEEFSIIETLFHICIDQTTLVTNMSRNVMTIIKWLPLESEENRNLFIECNQLKKSCEELNQVIATFLSEYQSRHGCKSYEASQDLLFQKLEGITHTLEALLEGFNSAFLKLNLTSPLIAMVKTNIWRNILWITKLKLCYFLNCVINEISHQYVHYGESILVSTFRIANVYNQCVAMDRKFSLRKKSTICSNSCPYLMYPMRKISITRLIQILAQNRAELCSHKLIDCLLDTYKMYENHEDDTSSDSSSIEIYRAITKHLSPPNILTNNGNNKLIKSQLNSKENGSFANIEELLKYEEQNVSEMLNVAVTAAPTLLGVDSIKKSRISGEKKISIKARAKVLGYYQEILWGEVGNFLEHIILWWGALPLASRPPHSSQHLREWITQFVQTIETPTYIISALVSLADALGLHVSSTSWDQEFRIALVSTGYSYGGHNTTGNLFSDVLQNLVALCNQCEGTSEWILGAPLEELPLVEQIPILHRLDHSIHTTRLWAITESKRLANNWNVNNFFMITHCDIINCLAQLNYLKLGDHTTEIEKGNLGPHVQVCVNMRAKLVSEVCANHHKLKDTPNECVQILSSVCRLVSLANLQLIFPAKEYYQKTLYGIPDKPDEPSGYVNNYLDEILTPVLEAIEDHHISNMVLKIMCEAWLDHIYINKIKFSHKGAGQLLIDFGCVREWLIQCSILTKQNRKKMLHNEVLRRCEGVGRLLLRSPGEHIKMTDNNKRCTKPDESPVSDNTELMPPEMYVPNQEQWLELRAQRRGIFTSSLCCTI